MPREKRFRPLLRLGREKERMRKSVEKFSVIFFGKIETFVSADICFNVIVNLELC